VDDEVEAFTLDIVEHPTERLRITVVVSKYEIAVGHIVCYFSPRGNMPLCAFPREQWVPFFIIHRAPSPEFGEADFSNPSYRNEFQITLMWQWLLCIDMRANHHSNGTNGSTTTAVAEFAVAVGLLGGLVALLAAASYPGVAAAVVTGLLSVAVVRKGVRLVAATGPVCVPGMDVCLRSPA
jgi:hypothetical protein